MIKEGSYVSNGKVVTYKKGGTLPEGFETVRSIEGDSIYDSSKGEQYFYAKGGRIDYDADIEKHKARDAKKTSKQQSKFNKRADKINAMEGRSNKLERLEKRNRNLDRRSEDNLSANYNDPEAVELASLESKAIEETAKEPVYNESNSSRTTATAEMTSSKGLGSRDRYMPKESVVKPKEEWAENTENVVTDFDKNWDYKKSGDGIFTKKKGSDKWIKVKGDSNAGLEISKKVFGESIDKESQAWKAPSKEKPVTLGGGVHVIEDEETVKVNDSPPGKQPMEKEEGYISPKTHLGNNVKDTAIAMQKARDDAHKYPTPERKAAYEKAYLEYDQSQANYMKQYGHRYDHTNMSYFNHDGTRTNIFHSPSFDQGIVNESKFPNGNDSNKTNDNYKKDYIPSKEPKVVKKKTFKQMSPWEKLKANWSGDIRVPSDPTKNV